MSFDSDQALSRKELRPRIFKERKLSEKNFNQEIRNEKKYKKVNLNNIMFSDSNIPDI